MTLDDVLMEPVSVPRTLRFYKELRTVHELRKQIQKVLVHQDVGEPPSFVFTFFSLLPALLVGFSAYYSLVTRKNQLCPFIRLGYCRSPHKRS